MTSKLSLRLKLSDFINTEFESNIMEEINDIHNKLHIAVMLYLWFDEDEINSTDLKKFLMRWETKLSVRTVVKQGSYIKPNDFVWFDIVPSEAPHTSNKRFEFKYTDKKYILYGLKNSVKSSRVSFFIVS